VHPPNQVHDDILPTALLLNDIMTAAGVEIVDGERVGMDRIPKTNAIKTLSEGSWFMGYRRRAGQRGSAWSDFAGTLQRAAKLVSTLIWELDHNRPGDLHHARFAAVVEREVIQARADEVWNAVLPMMFELRPDLIAKVEQVTDAVMYGVKDHGIDELK